MAAFGGCSEGAPILPAADGEIAACHADKTHEESTPMLRTLRCLLMFATGLLAAAAVQAQPLADPRVDWFSADSANFRVHYRAGHRAQAEGVARAAEAVYPRVTEALQWKPRTRTEIVLYSEYDVANGFSTPLPYNFMGVFLAPPDDGQLLDNSALARPAAGARVHPRRAPGQGARRAACAAGHLRQRALVHPQPVPAGLDGGGSGGVRGKRAGPGQGAAEGPVLRAWLRAERARGFITLREINADGRRLPLAKQYLYGAYFMEFMARQYGAKAIGGFVEQYSGNIVPRLHSGPYGATGKMMDELWDEFVADLGRQVDERAAPLKAQPEAVGEALAGPLFSVDAIAALPGSQGWLAVVGDGTNGTHLMRIARDGSRERVARVNAGTRISVAPDGGVLLAQPDICNTLYYAYDLYRLEGRNLKQLTHCAHLRRAVQAGATVLALELKDGATRLVQLEPTGATKRVFAAADGSELLDLAVTPDGRGVHLLARTAATGACCCSTWRSRRPRRARCFGAPRRSRACAVAQVRAGGWS